MFASPCDVIKVRFQVDGNLPVEQRRYNSLTDAYKKIYKADGYHFLSIKNNRVLAWSDSKYYQKWCDKLR